MPDLWFLLVVLAAYGGYVSGRKRVAARCEQRREKDEERARIWREGLDETLREAGLRLDSSPLILVSDASDSAPSAFAGFEYELSGGDIGQVSSTRHLPTHLEKRLSDLEELDAESAGDVVAARLPYLDTPLSMMR